MIKPCLIYKPWGGEHFSSWGEENSDKKIGEIILLSTIKEFKTCIETQDNQVIPFSEYWSRTGKHIAKGFGSRCGDDFPFLLKFLSTKEPLSIQVHPSTEDLKKIFNIEAKGKFESWFILDKEKNSKIFLGLRDEYDVEDLFSLEEREDPLAIFNQFTPQTGDIFCLEPGTIHGTLGSLLFFEIQQPSDFTYRIYDFGRGRGLHLEEARKIVKKRRAQKNNSSEILMTPEFSLKIKKADSLKDYKVEKPFEVLTYIGPPSMLLSSFEAINLTWGSTLLLWNGTELGFEESLDDPMDGGSFKVTDSTNRNEALFLLSSE